MALSRDNNESLYQIRGYKPGFIQINETLLTRSLLIQKDRLILDWPPQSFEALTSSDFNILLDLKPSLVILGTGTTLRFPPLELYGELLNRGIGVEIMDTHAACRTFTILTAENRDCLAALIIK